MGNLGVFLTNFASLLSSKQSPINQIPIFQCIFYENYAHKKYWNPDGLFENFLNKSRTRHPPPFIYFHKSIMIFYIFPILNFYLNRTDLDIFK